jgi:hypothetical protein
MGFEPNGFCHSVSSWFAGISVVAQLSTAVGSVETWVVFVHDPTDLPSMQKFQVAGQEFTYILFFGNHQ